MGGGHGRRAWAAGMGGGHGRRAWAAGMGGGRRAAGGGRRRGIGNRRRIGGGINGFSNPIIIHESNVSIAFTNIHFALLDIPE